MRAIIAPIVTRYAAMSGRPIHVDAPVVCPRVPGDPERLGQVIENVISNAVKYSAEGTPIRVSLSSNCASLTVTISNFGTTIPAEKLAFLFKRFSRLRLDADGNGRRKGTGLGLYICKEIVKAHGGTISATSSDGEGTKFTIELPVDPT
jgi:signal transduction histidine kinase